MQLQFRALTCEPRPSAQAPSLPLAFLITIAACAAPHHHAAGAAAVVDSVEQRSATAAELQQAFELAQIGPLSFELPAAPAALDADDDAFWQAQAFAYNPAVREARRKLLGQRALVDSAGRPGPIGLEVEGTDWGGGENSTEVKLTFDLLGILGLGPAEAAKALATSEERLAFAELESSVWRALFDVDRARVKVAAARERIQLLEGLRREAAADERRIRVLAERGRLSASDVAWSGMLQRELEQAAADARAALAGVEAELAIAAGLPIGAPQIQAISPSVIARWSDWPGPAPLPDANALFQSLPRLREMRMWCALAEARLRTESTARWPELDLGPRAIFLPQTVLYGGVLDVALPFFGANDGRIQAALQECLRMGEAVEDTLLASLADLHSAAQRLAESRLAAESAEPNDRASDSMWRAARARFYADAAELGRWCTDLAARTSPMLDTVDRREQAALAALDLQEACGPPRLAPARVAHVDREAVR